MHKNALATGISLYFITTFCHVSYANNAPAYMSPIKVKPDYNANLIYHTMLGYIADSRDEYQTALDNYIIVAQATRNPEIVQQATEYAIGLRDITLATKMAKMWSEVAEDDLQAQMVALTLHLNSDIASSKNILQKIMVIEPNSIDELMVELLAELRVQLRPKLQQLIIELANENPDSEYANLSAAQVSAYIKDIPTAINYNERALAIKPDLNNAIELKSKIINHQQSTTAALEYLRQQVANYPKLNKLRLFYSSALVDNNNLSEAIKHLHLLTREEEFAGPALLFLSNIYLEQKDFELAKNYLEQVIEYDDYTASAKFILGQIAEQEDDIKHAIQMYSEVEDGEYHVAASLRAAFMLSMEKDYKKALKVIHKASPESLIEQKQLILAEIDILISIEDYPEALRISNMAIMLLQYDIDLLYSRGIIYSKTNQLNKAEEDFQTILQIDPQHANALNSLGYIISMQPSRAIEASAYLEKAITIDPHNPAFIDSMGWHLFKLGKVEEALIMLKRAYSYSQDSEIAAHFGEALWSSGNKQQAKVVLFEALKSTPDNLELKETIKRLDVKPDTKNQIRIKN